MIEFGYYWIRERVTGRVMLAHVSRGGIYSEIGMTFVGNDQKYDFVENEYEILEKIEEPE